MEKSSNYYLKTFICLLWLICFISCQQNPIIYKKEYTPEEKLALYETLMNASGTNIYYQGSVAERMLIHEGLAFNPSGATGQRELGVPYLKRGFASKANDYYTKAVEEDPQEWLGYKAYCWLYFYRDYKTVLEEVDRYDAYTPDFVDYPQSTSVNFMRGVSYLQLGDYDNAITYLDMHLNFEAENTGYDYVEYVNYVVLGQAYQQKGLHEKADSIYSLGLLHHSKASELHFHKAQNLKLMGKENEAKSSLDLAQNYYTEG